MRLATFWCVVESCPAVEEPVYGVEVSDEEEPPLCERCDNPMVEVEED